MLTYKRGLTLDACESCDILTMSWHTCTCFLFTHFTLTANPCFKNKKFPQKLPQVAEGLDFLQI